MPKKKQPPTHENAVVLAYDAIVDLYKSESDRASAILAASHLEVAVEWVLRAYLVAGKPTDDMFDSNGPLATFSGKVKTAHAVGLMQSSVLHDLDLIRKIRNHFAHTVEAISFDEDPVKTWCNSFAQVAWPDLRPEDSIKSRPPRDQFLQTVAGMSAWADWTLDRIKGAEVARCTPPSEKLRFEPW
jgi:hypothetical protein